LFTDQKYVDNDDSDDDNDLKVAKAAMAGDKSIAPPSTTN
jgi:hypothetical protein